MSNIIELRHVSYTYGRKTPFEIAALNDLNLNIEKGSITGIIGHTGSGKSTLVRLLNGLERPDSGKVLFDGIDIWEKPKEISEVRYRVGLVMQYPEYQLFEESVAEDIAYGPRNMGLDDEEVARRVSEASKLVGLSVAELKKSPFDLSGGQKRRAAIAGVLAMKPEVLVLDEPAAGLDPIGRNTILRAICEYCINEGATVIIVSHSMEDMAIICDRIAVINNGTVMMEGTRDEVFGAPERLLSVGLDIPEITHVANKIVTAGYVIGHPIYTVSDAANEIAKLIRRRSQNE